MRKSSWGERSFQVFCLLLTPIFFGVAIWLVLGTMKMVPFPHFGPHSSFDPSLATLLAVTAAVGFLSKGWGLFTSRHRKGLNRLLASLLMISGVGILKFGLFSHFAIRRAVSPGLRHSARILQVTKRLGYEQRGRAGMHEIRYFRMTVKFDTPRGPAERDPLRLNEFRLDDGDFHIGQKVALVPYQGSLHVVEEVESHDPIRPALAFSLLAFLSGVAILRWPHGHSRRNRSTLKRKVPTTKGSSIKPGWFS